MSSQNPNMIVNGGPSTSAAKSPAEMLEQQHSRDAHNVTVEDVVDEEDKLHPPPSLAATQTPQTPAPTWIAAEKDATPKDQQQPSSKPQPKKKPFDVQSEESFPALGGGTKSRASASMPMAWGTRKPNTASNSNVMNGGQPEPHLSPATSTHTSPLASTIGASSSAGPVASGPAAGSSAGARILTMPGKHVEQIRFAPSQMLTRNQLKRSIQEIVRDISKKSKARLDVREGPNSSYIFEGVGTVDAVRQALKEVAQQVGSKQSVRVPVPASSRPHIIGRQGVVIQGIHERTGARIQVPRPDDSTPVDDDDDETNTIDVLIEGDAVAAEMARREIEARVKERTSNINLRVKNIAPELFPFVAGAHNANLNEIEERTKTQIRVPRYDTWSHRPPPQENNQGQIQFVPDPDQHILICGERTAAQDARSEIERRAQDLQHQITLRQLAINRGQHQFILGDKAGSLHDFLADTGCAVILPPSSDDTEFLTVTGPRDQIEFGIDRAMDLATSMQMASIDLCRLHPNVPGGSQAHARALTLYLQQRRVIEHLEKTHKSHIVLPLSSTDGPVTWEVYSRDGKNTILARSDILNLIQAHPPSKLATVPVDPYLHGYLRSRGLPKLKTDFGVHLVVPDDPSSTNLVLAYEGQDDVDAQSPFLRSRPSNDDATAFAKALEEARSYLLSVIGDQNDIITKEAPVPVKYHEKLRKFVTREQQSKGDGLIPVSMNIVDQGASLRGKSKDVEELASKILAFVAEQQRDDLERGYTTSFDFPQKFANFLIGRRGENINKLRDEFDVDIKVENGKVEVKGPKAKADAAKIRIVALGKKLEDEATYVLKIAPQYHRDLIGQKGGQVNRLQERYSVRVQFPRAVSAVLNDDQSVADTASDAGGARNRSNQASDEVVIRGPRKGADGAKEEILSLYQWVVDHSHSASISVARSQIPSLIGQRGREMEKLRAETGAQIDVPGVNDDVDASGRVPIKVKGTKKQVEDARKLLLQRAKEFDATVTKTIDVDKKHHKSLIGGGGANIRKIVVDAGGPDDGSAARIVKFPRVDSPETTIRLEGTEDIVSKIVAAIEEFVQLKEDQVVETLDVPQSQHRLLIGRGGDARRQIETQFNVILDVPKQGSGRTDVKLKGPSGAVIDAKSHVLSILEDHQGETVQVPRNLHHTIAENGAFFRRLRNDHQVTVDHAGEQTPSRPSVVESRNGADGPDTSLPLITDDSEAALDTFSWKIVDSNLPEPSDESSSATIPWVLSGAKDNVTKAKSILEKAIASASEPSSTGYLILPDPKTYRFVVGPGGSQINAIRKRTGCRINVPKDQSKTEAIEIKGSKDNLEVAKDMILDAVKAGTNGGGSRRT